MKLTRRELMECFLSSIVLTMPLSTYGKSEFDWQVACKKWMHILLPEDEYGLGASAPEIWAEVYLHIVEKAGGVNALRDELRRLEDVVSRVNVMTLDEIYHVGGESKVFLQNFHGLLLDTYYSHVSGWNELNIMHPPQPRGFVESITPNMGY